MSERILIAKAKLFNPSNYMNKTWTFLEHASIKLRYTDTNIAQLSTNRKKSNELKRRC